MLVAWEGIHQVIGKRIDQQTAGKKKSSRLSVSQSQPQPGESKCGRKKKSDVASDHQVVSCNNVRLRRSDPEVKDAFQGKAEKPLGMFPDEFADLVLFFLHETNFAQLLKSAHGLP